MSRGPLLYRPGSPLAPLVSAALLAALLTACGGVDKRSDGKDGAPVRSIKASDVKDAKPRPEPRAAYGNGPVYEVWGETYHVMPSAAGYRERGLASWYGSKFHGRKTSSGEPYDLYKATAAHKTLPLPTYAEVTNLDNGAKVIVKINDRGPFHSDRIIDLSYAAARKIGIVEQGTGRVEVRAITFDEEGPDMRLSDETFLQAGAFKSKDSAKGLEQALQKGGVKPVDVKRSGGLYKVMVGPFKKSGELNDMSWKIVELGYERPHTVTR